MYTSVYFISTCTHSQVQLGNELRNDSITQYQTAGRDDLIEKEILEISFYEPYLPKQLSDEELSSAIKSIIAQVGAEFMKDIGKVMAIASKELAGKVDGKRINECAKALLP
ncbi:MAG: GatB/YqeY domain-containing protein [Thiovulaceae bacterium]|nr:GatB/YqeY domain-containing protein [Sulfurimonadaceae bacterium]